MLHSNKELSQLVVAYCDAYGVEHVIISPGSRNAPLIVGFTNHPRIKTYSVVDERCAAFFGLGIAQQSKKPVALVCTSGSALLNYYPAIAEAFYSNIPLIIISADRPQHLIDIGDGQTIRQENVFKNHSLFNANLIEGLNFINENAKLTSDAIQASVLHKGPVHINVPFDEPLYDNTDLTTVKNILINNNFTVPEVDYGFQNYAKIWNSASKKMVLIGANYPNEKLEQQLIALANDESVLIFTENTSNVHHHKFINSIDKLIFPLSESDFLALKPMVLITLGGMIISKKIKQYIRKHQPKHHWHVDENNEMDTYHCLTQYFKMDPTVFFENFLPMVQETVSGYQKYWLKIKSERNDRHAEFAEKVIFSDFKVVEILLKSIPENLHVQFGNSSVIRYAQLFDNNHSLNIFCNRGTSGIDGSTSTAIGAAQIFKGQTVLITGDISFFYDSNALWNKNIKNNFRIILINNKGGGIFKILPNPSKTNALDYFETQHNFTAQHLCKMYDFQYESALNKENLIRQLELFFSKSNRPKLLEIFTPNMKNDKVLKNYFNFL